MPAVIARDLELNYLESGEGIHNAVFLHGNLQSAKLWHDFIEGMPEEYHCRAFDLRGFGDSAKSGDGVNVDTLADDIRYALHTLGLMRCSVLAFGEGARVAQSLAARYPSFVYKLALMGADAVAGDPAAARARAVELEELSWNAQNLARLLKPDYGLPRNRKLPEEFVEAASTSHQPAAVALARSVATGDTLSLLPHITARTVIIRGADDPVVSSADAEIIRSRIPGAEFVELSHTRRLPALADADSYRTAALKLLEAM
jgi:pimeloyl-ACP methyl ester carboxylesterase